MILLPNPLSSSLLFYAIFEGFRTLSTLDRLCELPCAQLVLSRSDRVVLVNYCSYVGLERRYPVIVLTEMAEVLNTRAIAVARIRVSRAECRVAMASRLHEKWGTSVRFARHIGIPKHNTDCKIARPCVECDGQAWASAIQLQRRGAWCRLIKGSCNFIDHRICARACERGYGDLVL